MSNFQMSNFKLASVEIITKGFWVSNFIGKNIHKRDNYGLERRYTLLFGY